MRRKKEDADTVHNDIVMVGLRTSSGLDLDRWPQYADRWIELSRPDIESGDMVVTDGRLVISEHAWPMADSFISDLLIV